MPTFKKLDGEEFLGEFKGVETSRSLVFPYSLFMSNISTHKMNVLITNKRIFLAEPAIAIFGKKLGTDDVYDNAFTILYFSNPEAESVKKKANINWFSRGRSRYWPINKVEMDANTVTLYPKNNYIEKITLRQIGKQAENFIKSISLIK